MPAPQYLLDDPREADRLIAKVNTQEWVERYVRPHVVAGMKVLDVGCGPLHLAHAVVDGTGAHVSGVDISRNRGLCGARGSEPYSADFTVGNAQSLPFKSDTFDVVYCRFLLEYLPDKHQAVRELVRVCRPGGLVLLQDLDGQLLWNYPRDNELENGIGDVLDRLAETDFDPYVGRKLYTMAYRASLGNIAVSVEPYHLIAGEPEPETQSLWERKLDIVRARLGPMLGEARVSQACELFLNFLKRPDTFTYSVVITVLGRKSSGATL